MIQFEDKFMEVQSSMVSLALEYVHGQADKIFIYAIADSLYSYVWEAVRVGKDGYASVIGGLSYI